MNTFALAFLGGIFGAVLMDITETAMARVGIRSGVNVATVGRWFLGPTRGRLAHADIQASPLQPREAGVGWAPRGANALLASPLSHIPLGLGIGTVMAMGSGFL